MTEWEQILAKQPSEARFSIVMAANSTTPTWADIPTKLDKNHAWHIVGMEYTFESVAAATPAARTPLATLCEFLQLQRGLASEVLLTAFHQDVAIHHSTSYFTDGTGSTYQPNHPVRVPADLVTRHQNLRALYVTSADHVNISADTIQIAGKVLYHIITAPDDGRTKLGIPIDEI